jgi:quercetin dioxygenase-like cupin family protein
MPSPPRPRRPTRSPSDSPRRKPEPILSRMRRRTIQTERETLEVHRLGVFDGWTIELVELNAGQHYPPHIHQRAAARLQVVVGTGMILLDGAPLAYRAGDVFLVLPGISHGFDVDAQTVLLSSQDSPIFDLATGEIDLRYVDSRKG